MTLAEIVVAGGILIGVVSATLGWLDLPQRAVVRLMHGAEVQQRARVALTRLQRDLSSAGVLARDPATGRVLVRPALVPTGTGRQHPESPDAADRFDPAAVTIVRVDGERTATTTSAVSPGMGSVSLRSSASCSATEGAACVFRRGALVVIADRATRSHVLEVVAVDGDVLTLGAPNDGALPSYGSGSWIARIEMRSYRFDPVRAQLRYRRDQGAEVPVVDHVVGVRFHYRAVAAWPAVGPGGTPSLPACVAAAIPSRGSRPAPGQVVLSAGRLADGPWCGIEDPFDADLLRVSGIGIAIRLEASSAVLRGSNEAMFARPGSAVDPTRWVPDVTMRIDVSLRVPWRP